MGSWKYRNRANVLVFVSFLVVQVFLLHNILLASVSGQTESPCPLTAVPNVVLAVTSGQKGAKDRLLIVSSDTPYTTLLMHKCLAVGSGQTRRKGRQFRRRRTDCTNDLQNPG